MTGKRAGRPALIKKEEKKEIKLSQNAELRRIENWNRKLKHMYSILTAEDGFSKCQVIYSNICSRSDANCLSFDLNGVEPKQLDEFESEFNLRREDMHKMKNLIETRS